jgi:hypothetical protein
MPERPRSFTRRLGDFFDPTHLGTISLKLAILQVIALALFMVVFLGHEFVKFDPLFIVAGILLVVVPLVSLAGFVLGLLGLFMGRDRIQGIFGALLNGVILYGSFRIIQVIIDIFMAMRSGP